MVDMNAHRNHPDQREDGKADEDGGDDHEDESHGRARRIVGRFGAGNRGCVMGRSGSPGAAFGTVAITRIERGSAMGTIIGRIRHMNILNEAVLNA